MMRNDTTDSIFNTISENMKAISRMSNYHTILKNHS